MPFKIDARTGAVKHSMPAKIGPAVDDLYLLRQERLRYHRIVENIASCEAKAKKDLIAKYGRAEVDGAAGKLSTSTAERVDVPKLEDPDKFYAHVRKTGEFDLLERRLNREAVRQRWEAEKAVPGVGVFHDIHVSVHKKAASKKPKGVKR